MSLDKKSKVRNVLRELEQMKGDGDGDAYWWYALAILADRLTGALRQSNFWRVVHAVRICRYWLI